MGSSSRNSGPSVALAAVLLLAIPSGCDRPRAPTERTALVIVSPHWEGIRYEIENAFEAHMAAQGRDVDVVWLNPGGTSACLRFTRSRFKELGHGIGVDLFFGGGVEPYLELAGDGLLTAVDLAPELVATIPTYAHGVRLHDVQAGWYGTTLVTFGIVFNRPLLRRLGMTEPTSFEDLGQPSARTWVGLADLRMSGTVHMLYELILQARGWDEGYRLIARMIANSRRIYHHASEVPLEVGASEIALGMALDSYAWAQVEALGRESIDFIAPEGETIVNPDAVAMLRGAPQPELARDFIAFLLSPTVQRLWMLPRGVDGGPSRYALARMPIRPDILKENASGSIVTFDPFAPHRFLEYDPELGSRRWRLLNDIVGACLIDLHRDIADAWEDLLAAGRPPAAEELLTRPPVTAVELESLLNDDDSSTRNQRLARWATEAAERYRRAAKAAATITR